MVEGENMRAEKWLVYRKEVKKVSLIAAPMAATTILQYLMQVVAVIMVGHLGDNLLLSGVSIASSFINVTGFSVLVSSFFPLFISLYHIETAHNLDVAKFESPHPL